MAHYDDPRFDYEKYWLGRAYEHESEIIAVKKLLVHSHFAQSADLGGGYGRLTNLISAYSDLIHFIEPSQKLRTLAKKYLLPNPVIHISSGTVSRTHLPDNSLDLVVCIRVFHHLPDPRPAVIEFRRILKPGGLVLLEFANSLNLKARMNSFLANRPILLTPIDRRSTANIKKETIPFVNHHPLYIQKVLSDQNFSVKTLLSVSNFRSPLLKKFLPQSLLLFLESRLQTFLSRFYFGPSIFILAQYKPL